MCLLVSAALAMTGCANTGSSLLSSGVQPDSRLTSGQSAKFFSESGAVSCGVGALSGAAIGALVGGKNALTGAVVGGVAGCAAGYAGNYYLSTIKEKYKNTADQLAAMSQDIKKDTKFVDERTTVMRQVIKDNQATLAKIKQQKNQANFDKTSASRQIAQIDANLNEMKNEIKNMHQQRDAKKTAIDAIKPTTAADRKKIASLKQEYNTLNKKIVALQSEADGLYNQRTSISLG